MSPEAQQGAIGVILGWKRHADGIGWYRGTHPLLRGGQDRPDWLNDLNAMHEAEKILTDEQLGEYFDHLERISFVPRSGISWEDHMLGVGWNHKDDVLATASQRAEAFLRAVGKWDDAK